MLIPPILNVRFYLQMLLHNPLPLPRAAAAAYHSETRRLRSRSCHAGATDAAGATRSWVREQWCAVLLKKRKKKKGWHGCKRYSLLPLLNPLILHGNILSELTVISGMN